MGIVVYFAESPRGEVRKAPLLRALVNKLPGYAPKLAGWHHGWWLPTPWRRDDARVSKVRVLLGALVVVVLVVFAAGCSSDSDQGQAPHEDTSKMEAKGQQAGQTVKKKVEAKK